MTSAPDPQAAVHQLPPVIRITLRIWLKVYGGVLASARPLFDLAVWLAVAQVLLASGLVKPTDWSRARPLATFEYPVAFMDAPTAAVTGLAIEVAPGSFRQTARMPAGSIATCCMMPGQRWCLAHWPRVVVVGGGFGGFGGLACVSALRKLPVRVTLIDRQNYLFQPLLYQGAKASLFPADVAIPIRRLFRRDGNVSVSLAASIRRRRASS